MNNRLLGLLVWGSLTLLLAPLVALHGAENGAVAPAGLRKLLDTPLRDPSICRGPDGTYYLTGTSEPFWGYNNENGIRVWKSKDLTTWEPLGTVWRYGTSPWHEKYLKAKEPLWAPGSRSRGRTVEGSQLGARRNEGAGVALK